MSGQHFISGSRDQAFLLPPDMREWLPDDHLVWVIVEALERCDLAALDSAYRADGNGGRPMTRRLWRRCCSTPTRAVNAPRG
jgi:hypothetical protein